MAIENTTVTNQEGIIDEDIDKTIMNLGLIGTKGMNETDQIVLEMLTNK